MFLDLQCPSCKQLYLWLRNLPDELQNQVFVVVKHLPSPAHSWARKAALMTTCVWLHSEPAFWQAQDLTFERQAEVTEDNLERIVKSVVAIDETQLKQCETSPLSRNFVDRDIAMAGRFGVRATPGIFVNGAPVPVVASYEDLRKHIEEAAASRSTTDRDATDRNIEGR
jgi:protein-disulfide isomerase